jgi:heptose-I-phosphate ethanolaminephosphotransferase
MALGERYQASASKALNALQAVYPLWWLALALYPCLLTALINPNLFDIRDAVLILVWMPWLRAPGLLIKNKYAFLLGLLFLILESGIHLVHLLLIKGPPSASYFLVVANTHSQEATDFLQLKLHIRWWAILPYLLLIVMAIRTTLRETKTFVLNKWYLLIGCISFIFLAENALHQRFVRKGLPPTARALYSFNQAWNEYSHQEHRVAKHVSVTGRDSTQPELMVLIIGESLTRRHMSLYGYHLPTNPRLQQRKDLWVFQQAVSPYSHTLTALMAALTESNIDREVPVKESTSIIDVYRSAGYETFWISNQSPVGIWDNAVYDIAQTAHHNTFINRHGNSSFETTLLASYDEDLLQPFSEALRHPATKKLIVLHLMGNHSLYHKRYPSAWNYFTESTNQRQTTINEYNNAVRYNDYVVNAFFDTLQQYTQAHPSSHNAALYFSDHGENVYDENDAVGHDYTGQLPKVQVEVPFLFWSSQKHPILQSQNTWKQNLTIPFLTDDLDHILYHLSGFNLHNHDSTSSPFNIVFNRNRKLKLEDGSLYK